MQDITMNIAYKETKMNFSGVGHLVWVCNLAQRHPQSCFHKPRDTVNSSWISNDASNATPQTTYVTLD